jgi:hypothetical protein
LIRREFLIKKKKKTTQKILEWWWMLIILATWEMEIGRITVMPAQAKS